MISVIQLSVSILMNKLNAVMTERKYIFPWDNIIYGVKKKCNAALSYLHKITLQSLRRHNFSVNVKFVSLFAQHLITNPTLYFYQILFIKY